MTRQKIKIVMAAGGTGGHLFPAQQLAAHLQKEDSVLFAGHKLSQNPFFEKGDFPFIDVDASVLGRGFLSASWKGFWKARRALAAFSPDVVVGFGSYHVFPVLLAALSLRRKIVLFEANCAPGKVNRFFAPFAWKVTAQFPTGLPNEMLVPLLPWRTRQVHICSAEARRHYGLDRECRTLLVFGGSQGASFFNEWIPKVIPQGCQAIHFAAGAEENVRKAYEKRGISAYVASFEKNMPLAYAAADGAVCRSGAGTLAELIRFAVPALLIPYPFSAEGHQKKNGEFLHRAGGAFLLEQHEASPDALERNISDLLLQGSAMRPILERLDKEAAGRDCLSTVLRSF